MFLGFLGYTYQPRGGSDVFRSIERFESLESCSFDSILSSFWQQLLAKERGGPEVFLNIMSYLTHLFSDNWRVMLAFWGVLIGIILIKFYDKLYDDYKDSNQSMVTKFFLLFLVFFVPPITSINGRFWLAYWVFIYFALQYVGTKEKKYLLLAFLPVFIHQGTIFASLILFFYALTHNFHFSPKLYYLLIIAAILYSALGLDFIRALGENLGGSYEDFVQGYTSEKYISYISERTQIPLSELSLGHRFFRLRGPILYFSLLIVLAYWRFKKRLNFTKQDENLYLMVLLFLAVQIFLSKVPSVGGRYQIFLMGLMLILYFKLSCKNILSFKDPSVLILLPAVLFYFLTTVRLEFEQLYGFFFLSNPISELIYVQEVSFLELIR